MRRPFKGGTWSREDAQGPQHRRQTANQVVQSVKGVQDLSRCTGYQVSWSCFQNQRSDPSCFHLNFLCDIRSSVGAIFDAIESKVGTRNNPSCFQNHSKT
eukprot:1182687-Prorocentrum_minimum.AAC.10